MIAIATNQSAIGRGIISVEEFAAISEFMQQELAKIGVDLWSVVACPHAPTFFCQCRKPKPGLLEKLVQATNQEKLRIAYVGNSDSDIAAANSARYNMTSIRFEPHTTNHFDSILYL